MGEISFTRLVDGVSVSSEELISELEEHARSHLMIVGEVVVQLLSQIGPLPVDQYQRLLEIADIGAMNQRYQKNAEGYLYLRWRLLRWVREGEMSQFVNRENGRNGV